ncbi:Type I phosphodiesterase / nucleotide pyrophosphatase [Chitinophaga jiangningensis]|uniref:Type I phosphodiesterase / nucleotide pyrophosphatase n=1 Tax=Chitinophaga jiangningensis TaxID=1419482 RepID=A0A1M6VEN4_9BACT|nr:alkaline phosphatase [Chitinophaga jiangningensis]SHK79746.1 Type I phosphodiesterase / nucleotide pyrophosphatase [Chitinophaga jiangningensis]
MKKLILAAALLLGGTYAHAQVKDVKHVILIGMDGFGAYSFPKVENPVMKQMMQDGAWTLEARSVLPSSSAVNWASMVMGAGPELHGYTEWDSKVPELPSRVLDQYGMFPSIYTLLREQKPTAEIGVIYSWQGIGYLFPKQAVNHSVATHDNDSLATAEAITYLKAKKPDFLFIHFDEPDGVGHNIGHHTPEYYTQVKKNDELLGKIFQGIKDAGMWENSIIILTADHGGIKKGHGGKSMDEMQIPWIIQGPGVKKNTQVKNSVMTYDTAATIAWIFGLKTPQVWIGRPVTEAFK